MSQGVPRGGAGVPAGGQMLRPHQIASLPFISDADKEKYANGLKGLWNQVETLPKDSEMHARAVAKIQEASRDLMRKISARGKPSTTPANRPQPQGQQVSQNQVPQISQQTQQTAQAQGQQTANAQNLQRPPSQQQQSHQGQQSQQQPSHNPQQSQQQQQQQVQMSQSARQFLQSFKVYPPPNIQPNQGSADYDAHRSRVLRSLQQQLITSEKCSQRTKEINSREQALHQSGQQLQPELVQQREQAKQLLTQAKAEFEKIKSENQRNETYWAGRQGKGDNAQSQGQGGANTTANTNVNQSQHQMSQQQSQAQQMRQQLPNVQTSQFGGNMDKGQGQQGQQSAMASSNSATFPNQNMPTSGVQSGQAQTPSQMQLPQQPPSNMPGRPQPMPQQQHFANPQHQSPATASAIGQQATGGPPQALSHQAAMSAAARTYSEQQQRSTPTQGTGQSFPSIPPSQQPVPAKMPIPKQLNVPSPSPVSMGAARPTFGGPGNGPAGMMGQPAMAKPPGFILEGEGDRGLSKKKLDELVRQVTGGGEGDGLTADVEEVRLSSHSTFTHCTFLETAYVHFIRTDH